MVAASRIRSILVCTTRPSPYQYMLSNLVVIRGFIAVVCIERIFHLPNRGCGHRLSAPKDIFRNVWVLVRVILEWALALTKRAWRNDVNSNQLPLLLAHNRK